MVFNKIIFFIYNLENMTQKESFWFFVGSAFGLWCGTTVFNLSLKDITLGSFFSLLALAFIYGMVYKDLGKKSKKVKH